MRKLYYTSNILLLLILTLLVSCNESKKTRTGEETKTRKTIEYKSPGAGCWDVDSNFGGSMLAIQYRIKSQPKLVPFTFEDKNLFKDKWVMQKKEFGGCGYLNRIVGISDKNIIMINSNGVLMSKSYEDLLRIYTFENGSPCGKYIEE